jgi:hypothetical protein
VRRGPPALDFIVMLPAAPQVPEKQRGSGTFPLRYEDISQDGRLLVEASTNGLDVAVWHHILRDHAFARAALRQGILPILSRLAVDATPGPFSVEAPMQAEGCYALAHGRDADGAVDRLYLNMWAELWAPRGLTYGPRPPRAGETTLAARLFAEHVLTRPFAPPEQRRVLRLDVPGEAPVPEERHAPRPHAALLELPEGAAPLDDTLELDPAPVALGLRHTDSNQHVNSLVYPHLFEEAALRRFAARGLSTAVLARSLEIDFRKPAFAGDLLRVALRAFRLGDRLGACGVFVAEAQAHDLATARPHAWVSMLFER